MDLSKNFVVSRQGINFARVYNVKEALREMPDFGDNNKGRAWNQSVSLYTTSAQIEVVPNCFAYMFTCLGDTAVRVNGMVVFPNATPLTALGDSRTMSGHWLDMYKGRIEIAFAFPAGAAPLLELVQVFYIPGDCKISGA